MSKLDFDDNRTLFRAVFAGIALHGMVQKIGITNRGWRDAVESAVDVADLLLEELESDEPKEELGVAALRKTRRKTKEWQI